MDTFELGEKVFSLRGLNEFEYNKDWKKQIENAEVPDEDRAKYMKKRKRDISRRIKNICNELLQHFTTIADEKFDLDKDQFKELLNQFDQSWHTSVAKILG